ncbi:alpha/beta-hydrolase [Mytilinidion resinicola]|uniref:Carboxylic ester hydrolase n=1 Tax=Mytilinidion resinicola TaxID=574789 RepID=A0A6A6Y4U1_9PEZI|nr:alpha/beta-hydrolase [Mytilinidion resinicola]KAF2803533.1 alpha/beta-hydrolase [Mytilinidion resinicola]
MIGTNVDQKASVVLMGHIGIYSSEWDQDFFLGVPYALPPTATKYAAACVGYGSDHDSYSNVSEDCLYLNIVRPSSSVRPGSERLPVVVWIHGGALNEGSANDLRYNLTFIVDRSVKIDKPIIAVSINYRLSIWGFITGNEAIHSGNANLGLKDQRLALKWVKENIGYFGGNTSQITIWGESAGAFSVGAHLTAYGSRDDNLFHGAIMQPGSPLYYGSIRDWNKTAYNIVSEGMSCNTMDGGLQCLREVSFEKRNSFITETGLTQAGLWQPVVDGDFIQGHASEQLADGAFVRVPIITGANSDEGTAVVNGTLFDATLDNEEKTDEYSYIAPWLSARETNTLKFLESTFPRVISNPIDVQKLTIYSISYSPPFPPAISRQSGTSTEMKKFLHTDRMLNGILPPSRTEIAVWRTPTTAMQPSMPRVV